MTNLEQKRNARHLKELVDMGCVVRDNVVYPTKEDAVVDYAGQYVNLLHQFDDLMEWTSLKGYMSSMIAAQKEINERVARCSL